MKDKKMKKVRTNVIILGLLLILPFVCTAYSDYMMIVKDERERSAKHEEILIEWLVNSGWENEIEITKTEYKYNKAHYDWFYSTLHPGYGYLNIYFNYNNQKYTVCISNLVANNDEHNAYIYWTIHHDEIIQHRDIGEFNFINSTKGIKPSTTIEEAIQLYENSSIKDSY